MDAGISPAMIFSNSVAICTPRLCVSLQLRGETFDDRADSAPRRGELAPPKVDEQFLVKRDGPVERREGQARTAEGDPDADAPVERIPGCNKAPVSGEDHDPAVKVYQGCCML